MDKLAPPRHIAIIMDGNGRWATARGLSRSEGHLAGAKQMMWRCCLIDSLGILPSLVGSSSSSFIIFLWLDHTACRISVP